MNSSPVRRAKCQKCGISGIWVRAATRELPILAVSDTGGWRCAAGRAAAAALPVYRAISPSVISPMLEMSVRRARLVGGSRRSAIPVIMTLAVSVTKIAGAARFGDFDDRVVFRLID